MCREYESRTEQCEMKYSVPKGDGESLFYPAWDRAPELIETNHSLLESHDFEMAGTSFHQLRASVRREVAAQAGQRASEKLRIIVGAHQPGFQGPGIMYKYGVLEAFSRHNFSLNYVVDSDVCKEISVKIPYLRGRSIGLRELVIFRNREGLVFEKLPLPPKEIVDLRYREIRKLLASVGTEGMLHAFNDFLAVHERVYAEEESAAKILTGYRQGYYPTRNVYETSISAISHSKEFQIFACDIIEEIEEFHRAYNSSLDEHRRLHHIRSPANPFPGLIRDGELWELPLWGLDSLGRRHKLFAGGAAGKRFVVRDDVHDRTSPIEPETVLLLRMRPRAVCLTIFLRLFVGDLFVHGVGGGNYDQVTDRIIEKYYAASPPGYVVCSRTRFLSNQQSAVLQAKASQLREKLRRMRHTPEKFAPEGNPLAEEARLIIVGCEGKLSAEEHVRLDEIRRRVLERITPEMSLTEKELEGAEEALHRQSALHRRGLPYFLYPQAEL